MPASLSALNRGRRAAQADMRSVCRLTVPGDGEVWDEELLQYVPADPVVVYEGKCKLRRVGALTIKDAEAAGQLFIRKGSTLHLPVDGSGGVVKDAVGVILSSVTDPQVVGAKFKVEAAEAYDNPTSRRFTVEGTQ